MKVMNCYIKPTKEDLEKYNAIPLYPEPIFDNYAIIPKDDFNALLNVAKAAFEFAMNQDKNVHLHLYFRLKDLLLANAEVIRQEDR